MRTYSANIVQGPLRRRTHYASSVQGFLLEVVLYTELYMFFISCSDRSSLENLWFNF